MIVLAAIRCRTAAVGLKRLVAVGLRVRLCRQRMSRRKPPTPRRALRTIARYPIPTAQKKLKNARRGSRRVDAMTADDAAGKVSVTALPVHLFAVTDDDDAMTVKQKKKRKKKVRAGWQHINLRVPSKQRHTVIITTNNLFPVG